MFFSKKRVFGFILSTFASPLFAHQWDLGFALGIDQPRTQNSSFALSPTEVVNLQPTSQRTAFAQNLSVGSIFKVKRLGTNQTVWFGAIEPTLSLYHFSGSASGHSYDFGTFNYFDYKMNLSSTRLMAELLLSLFSAKHCSWFALVGMGGSFNSINYNETTVSSALQSWALHLNSQNSTTFAAEVGAGLRYQFNPHFLLSLQYEYVNLGNWPLATTGTIGAASVALFADGSVNVHANEELIGIHWLI